jgi:hypothetical protein
MAMQVGLLPIFYRAGSEDKNIVVVREKESFFFMVLSFHPRRNLLIMPGFEKKKSFIAISAQCNAPLKMFSWAFSLVVSYLRVNIKSAYRSGAQIMFKNTVLITTILRNRIPTPTRTE